MIILFVRKGTEDEIAELLDLMGFIEANIFSVSFYQTRNVAIFRCFFFYFQRLAIDLVMRLRFWKNPLWSVVQNDFPAIDIFSARSFTMYTCS